VAPALNDRGVRTARVTRLRVEEVNHAARSRGEEG
jgi:hypothetical protein